MLVILALTAAATALAVQAIALATRLPGLHLLPRASPRAFALLPLGLSGLAWAWLALQRGHHPLAWLGGILLGVMLATVLPRLRPLRPDAEVLQRGQPLEIEGHADAQALLLSPQGPACALVLVAHGGGNDRLFALWHLIPRLNERGFAVALFNHAGHGMGGTDLLDVATFRARFDAVVAAVRKTSTVPLVALGQSMGGALVLDAIARGVALDGAVTISAITRLELGMGLLRELGVALHPSGWQALRHATPLELLPAAGPFGRARFPVRVAAGRGYLSVFAQVLEALELPPRLRHAAPSLPVLVIQGAADGIVPVAQGREIAAALGPGARYLERADLHHMDPLFDERVIDAILDFIDAATSGQPGASRRP
ncbi:MAG: alpha/beta hydrolase [Deltaproteobacteria bacterium]|nr:alpha/beta hydrolase [Deltaproteobacteria bacterium]